MKELNEDELMMVSGGDKFMRDLGHLCGDIVQAIEEIITAGPAVTITGTVVRY